MEIEGSFSGVQPPECEPATHLHLVLNLRMPGAIPPPSTDLRLHAERLTYPFGNTSTQVFNQMNIRVFSNLISKQLRFAFASTEEMTL